MEDIISDLFQKRTDEYKLEKGYEICMNARRKRESKTLYDFINKRVHPKSRKELIRRIESYTDAILDTMSKNNKTVYKAGFNDCMKLILNALSF